MGRVKCFAQYLNTITRPLSLPRTEKPAFLCNSGSLRLKAWPCTCLYVLHVLRHNLNARLI